MTAHSRTVRRRGSSEAGFTMIEMLIAVAIMMTVTGAVFALMNPSQGIFQTQPEVSDMQQRLRVGVDSMAKDLVMAGAGTYAGSAAGALYNFFAPVMPYRVGDVDDDPAKNVFYRADAITILYVPPTPSQTTIRDAMPKTAQQLKVNEQSNCPRTKTGEIDQHDALCGMKEGMRALIFDNQGNWDAITITSVQDEALHLGYDGELSVSYAAGSNITQVATHTYYLKTDVATKTFQLMHYDGYHTDLPVVDNVVSLQFQYFGDPLPPTLLPNKPLSGSGPWTTYGPKPPDLATTFAPWPKGENCAFMVDPVSGAQVSRLPVLGGGVGSVPLTEAMLKDGPWCPNASAPDRFDADLLRIRRVRVKLRVQVAQVALRGPAGVLFTYGGTSTGGARLVPDQEIRFDITPRNMNLGR